MSNVPETYTFEKLYNVYDPEHYPANKKITAEEWNSLFMASVSQGNRQENILHNLFTEILPTHARAINNIIFESQNAVLKSHNENISYMTDSILNVSDTGALIQTISSKDIGKAEPNASNDRIVIPVVDNKARLILPQEITILRHLEEWRQSLLGEAINYAVDFSDFPSGVTEAEKQNYLNNKWLSMGGVFPVIDQTGLIDPSIPLAYRWFANDNKWLFEYGSPVRIATNNIYDIDGNLVTVGGQGASVGSNRKYHVMYEANGEGAVNGLDELDLDVKKLQSIAVRNLSDGTSTGALHQVLSDSNGRYSFAGCYGGEANQLGTFAITARAGLTYQDWITTHLGNSVTLQDKVNGVHLTHKVVADPDTTNITQIEAWKQSYSFAVAFGEGVGTYASGRTAFAQGKNTVVSGNYAAGFGEACLVRGYAGFAANSSNQVAAADAAAFGYSNAITANGLGGFTTGSNNTVSGNYAAAFGEKSKASASRAFAAGGSCIAEGWSSAAFGQDTKTTAGFSFATGNRVQVNSAGGFGEGQDNIVQSGHDRAHVMGRNNKSSAGDQLTLGVWNAPAPGASLVIGNGTDDNNRSNVLEVYHNGTVKVAGTVLEVVKPKQYQHNVTLSNLSSSLPSGTSSSDIRCTISFSYVSNSETPLTKSNWFNTLIAQIGSNSGTQLPAHGIYYDANLTENAYNINQIQIAPYSISVGCYRIESDRSTHVVDKPTPDTMLAVSDTVFEI